jgi:hypothetical protein
MMDKIEGMDYEMSYNPNFTNADYEKNDKLRDFTLELEDFQKISNTAKHIYALGMPRLENEKTGLFKETITSYRELGDYSYVNFQSVSKALDMLNGVFCDISKNKTNTSFRRYTIKELKQRGIK